MTDEEVIETVRRFAERQFPRGCSGCGRTFPTLAHFLRETEHLGDPVSYDAEMGTWKPPKPWGTMTYANCRCGSTISVGSRGMGVATIWRLMGWLRRKRKETGKANGEILRDLRAAIDERVLAADEAAKHRKSSA